MTRLLLAISLALPAVALAVPAQFDRDGDGFEPPLDCDDADDSIFPGADEFCDGVDNDCNGSIDDDAVDAFVQYGDADGDGFGSAVDVRGPACQLAAGTSADDGDCDDTDPSVRPSAVEVCDGIDNDCDGTVDDGAVDAFAVYSDNDRDGYGAGAGALECVMPPDTATTGGDCDDQDPSIHPGATEIFGNGIDDDCDGTIDGDTDPIDDNDGDGHSSDTDCDDEDASVYPGAPEECDGIDNDCNGQIDEGAAMGDYARDADGDGFGSVVDVLTACVAPPGYVADFSDCDDADPFVYPGAAEVCDGLDNDCDGVVDDGGLGPVLYADDDGDGYGAGAPIDDCSLAGSPDHATVDGDCDDLDATIHPDAIEIAGDGIDQDCDGTDLQILDNDGDGHAPPDDCDDEDPTTFPGAPEACDDGLDQDCDGADEACDDDDEPTTCSSSGGGATFALLFLAPLLWRRR